MIDKVVLGIALAIVAYFFSIQLQNYQSIANYQKNIFDNRLKAYEDVLKFAKKARDESFHLHVPHPDKLLKNHSNLLGDELSWRTRLDIARVNILNSRGSHIGSFGYLSNYDEILKDLNEIENARRENALFISDAANKAIDRFINILLKDLNETIQIREEKKNADIYDAEAGHKIQSAYEDLRRSILEILRVRDVILG